MNIDATAVAWLVRQDLRALTDVEQAELAQWLRDPLHAASYQAARRNLQGLAAAADDPLLQALRDEALAGLAPTRAARAPLWRRPTTVAASLVILGSAVMFAVLRTVNVGAPDAAPASAAAVSVERYATARGQHRELSLPDGSHLDLDTDTQLEVQFSPQQRVIRLQHGQALFDVAKDASRPFLVQAGERTVRAVGTQFDVYTSEHELRVLLAEGKVTITRAGAGDEAQGVQLLPGQGLFVDAQQATQVRDLDVRRALRWREGFIEFNDQSLREAVEAMNRYTGTPVTLDERSAALRLSGVFRTERMDQFLEAVAGLLPVQVRTAAGGETEITAR